jgi:hypothetical protein
LLIQNSLRSVPKYKTDYFDLKTITNILTLLL